MSILFHAHGGSVFHVLSVIMTVQFHFLLMLMLIHVHVFHDHVGSCRMIHAHLLVNGGVPECSYIFRCIWYSRIRQDTQVGQIDKTSMFDPLMGFVENLTKPQEAMAGASACGCWSSLTAHRRLKL